jgi:hypothetical protein
MPLSGQTEISIHQENAVPRRALLLVPILLLVAACGGSSPTPTPAPTPTEVPSAGATESVPASFAAESPSGSTQVDEAFCGTITDLETTLNEFNGIKVKPANGQKLQDQAAKVQTAMDAITQATTADVSALADALGTSVDELNQAAADYATNSSGKTEEKRLNKAVNAVTTAISDLRGAAGCTT